MSKHNLEGEIKDTASPTVKPDWGSTPKLTAEQIVTWLDLHRQFMFEVWKNNPQLRERWLRINSA